MGPVRRSILTVGLLVGTLAACEVELSFTDACTTWWTGPTTDDAAPGDWADPAHWDAGAPDADDRACAPEGAWATVTGATTVASTWFEGRIDLPAGSSLEATGTDGHTHALGDLHLAGDLTIGADRPVISKDLTATDGATITGGSWLAGNTWHLSGDVLVTAADLQIDGTLTIPDETTITACDGTWTINGTATLGEPFYGQGEVVAFTDGAISSRSCPSPATLTVAGLLRGEATLDLDTSTTAASTIEVVNRIFMGPGVDRGALRYVRTGDNEQALYYVMPDGGTRVVEPTFQIEGDPLVAEPWYGMTDYPPPDLYLVSDRTLGDGPAVGGTIELLPGVEMHGLYLFHFDAPLTVTGQVVVTDYFADHGAEALGATPASVTLSAGGLGAPEFGIVAPYLTSSAADFDLQLDVHALEADRWYPSGDDGDFDLGKADLTIHEGPDAPEVGTRLPIVIDVNTPDPETGEDPDPITGTFRTVTTAPGATRGYVVHYSRELVELEVVALP